MTHPDHIPYSEGDIALALLVIAISVAALAFARWQFHRCKRPDEYDDPDNWGA